MYEEHFCRSFVPRKAGVFGKIPFTRAMFIENGHNNDDSEIWSILFEMSTTFTIHQRQHLDEELDPTASSGLVLNQPSQTDEKPWAYLIDISSQPSWIFLQRQCLVGLLCEASAEEEPFQ
jgi:hypothetical protein